MLPLVQEPGAAFEITTGYAGDRWLQHIPLVRVEQARHGDQYGYAVTVAPVGGPELTLFWSRDLIDFQNVAAGSFKLENMPLGDGRLRYPNRITRKSLPSVYRAIGIIEHDNARFADGAIRAVEGFADVALLGVGSPTIRAPRMTAPGAVSAMPTQAAAAGAQVSRTAPRLLPALSQTTQAQFMASATQQVARGNVTAVGRAIQKHAARPGSFFRDGRNAAENSRIGAEFISSLLSNPASTVTAGTHKVFGPIVKVRLPNGAGAQFEQSGTFIGLLEPFAR